MKNKLTKIKNLPKRIIYQVKHIFWIRKVAKEKFKKIPFSFWFHDLDKIFLLRDKSVHSQVSKHHITFLIKHENQKFISVKNVKEMICDWECAKYFKKDKTLNAVEYFEVVKSKYYLPRRLNYLIQSVLSEYKF